MSSTTSSATLHIIFHINDPKGFIIKEDPKVKHFRRHIALLRPSVVVIYDELASAMEVDWQFALNTREQAPLEQLGTGMLLAKGEHAWASATITSSEKQLQTKIRDKYLVPPVDWLNPQRGRKARDMSATHYHSTTGPQEKLRELRFLTVIKIAPEKEAHQLVANADGSFDIDGFHIRAELDTSKTPMLHVKSSSAELLYGGGKELAPFRHYRNSTILQDSSDVKPRVREAFDTLPLKLNQNQ